MMIRPARAQDFASFYGRAVEMFSAIHDGKVMGIGGLYIRADGRRFLVLDVRRGAHGINMVKWTRRWMKTKGKPLYAACWEWQYDTAPRLLRVLGFEPTDEVQDDRKRVWVCK